MQAKSRANVPTHSKYRTDMQGLGVEQERETCQDSSTWHTCLKM